MWQFISQYDWMRTQSAHNINSNADQILLELSEKSILITKQLNSVAKYYKKFHWTIVCCLYAKEK